MVAIALVVGACGLAPVSSPTSIVVSQLPTTTTTAASTTTARHCRLEPVETVFTSTDPVELSLTIANATLDCVDELVVASGSPDEIEIAGRFAASRDIPLLIAATATDLTDELNRLAPTSVTVIGDILPSGIPAGTETESLTVAAAAAQSSTDDASSADAIWLADATRPDLAAPVIALAASRGEGVLLADPANVLGDRALVTAVRQLGPTTLFMAGGFDPATAEWQRAALSEAPELPGGGLTMFPGRRLVALYGNPTTPALGVLGEQGPEEAVARAREIAAGYEADGTPILHGFEIIATVASAGATADGNYSEEMTTDILRPWIEVAASQQVYVILDLQPGRTDFLTQAKLYEEFLRLPYVGLALDPEWRLEPDQVHLRQIGSVEAAEVNQVSEWLAGVVRDHNLPQKFFLLHQFRLDMIENRELVQIHPELATVIQMDGQGPLHTKYETWNALLPGTEGSGINWGWKNFYDEDTPRGGATPAEVLALDPVPVYVSYQ
ncbi:MAG TPA: hypothetical protein VJ815_02840 [Acidimicrobiia bacterium]|nr:hypothetical protein [Acidimicrobiia bacterium]